MPPFHDHFSDVASGYAAHRPGYPVALVEWLAELAPRAEVAWDAGCGSGQLSVPLAARFARVVATDASAEQIARAAPHPRVEYRRAPAGASGLPDASTDLAVAAQAAHWFDLDAYYAEVRRVVRPDGAVALVSYGALRTDPGVDGVVRRFYAPLAPYWPPERRAVEEGYRSLPFPFEEIPAPPLEIRVHWTADDLLGYVGTWSAVRALERARGQDRIDAFRRDLLRAWGPGEEARAVRWPLSLRAGRVRGGADAARPG